MRTEAPPAGTPPAAPAPLAMKDLITEAGLADRAYLKDYAEKPLDKETGLALLKKLDGAEALIGRKIGIPGADAKPEEVTKFYESMRPAKPEDYEVKAPENADQEFVKEFRAAAHAAGMDKRQVSTFYDKMAAVLQARATAQAAEQAKLDKQFDEFVAQAHGKDAEPVKERVRQALAEHVPQAHQPFLHKLDNNALAVLTDVVNAILVKYVPEDDLQGMGKGGNAGGGNDPKALREEAMKLMADPAYRDFQNPKHAETVKRVSEIYANPAFKT